MELKLKLELEKIYEKYCLNELKILDESENGEDKEIKMLFEFVKFRLNVSGGNESSMSVSMFNVKNFLDEIFLFDNLLYDWSGSYRGEFDYEYLEVLEELLNESSLDDNVKEMIIKGYRDNYEMDDEN
jgi:hypothetical protein